MSMTTPENEAGKPEEAPGCGVALPRVAIIDEEEARTWKADAGRVAVVKAVLLPKGSEPPPWLDDMGMKFLWMLKERADEYIKAQRKAREQVEKTKARRGLKVVHGGRA